MEMNPTVCRTSTTTITTTTTTTTTANYPRTAQEASSIQYGYSKSGTLARVFPKHMRIGTARTKEDKQKREKMERRKVGT